MTISQTGAAGQPAIQFQGIESNLPTQQIIQALMQLDEAPLTALEKQQTSDGTKIAAYQALQTDAQAVQTAASAISGPNAFASALSAASTNQAVATASVGPGATQGSTTFSVLQLAQADTLVSSGTVASTSDVVASGNLLVAAGGSGLGISSMTGTGLTLGAHSISVTQASSAAVLTGQSALASSTTISSSNDTLALTVNGTATTYTIASGTYSASGLAQAITTATGGAVTASVNSSGNLVLTGADQGSSATLAVGSGSANTALGLSSAQSAAGTDGVISVDGTANTVNFIAGSGTTSVSLTSGTGGTLNAVLSGSGLAVGSITAQNVSVGSGSLQSVVNAINASGAGVNASALAVGTNQYALELSSQSTGAGNDISIAPGAFSSSALGSMTTTTQGQDAIVSVGGAGGYQVHSASNTVTGLLAGTSIQLQSVSSQAVTVSVNPDGTAASSLVSKFVNATNTLLSDVAASIAYNQQTNQAGPLNGDGTLEVFSQQILAAVGGAIGTSSVADSGTAGSAAGLSLTSSGQLKFDASTFAADFAKNPTAVGKLFTQAGSFLASAPAANSDVSLVYAGNATVPGTYAVTVSQSAAQATDTGTATFSSGTATVSGGETYTISSGGSNVNVAVSAGETLQGVASAFDTAFAQSGLGLSAQVVASGTASALQITSAGYGSSQSFTVSTNGSDEFGIASTSPFVGVDVAGTINGVAATGNGQVLSAPSTDPTLAGLALQITTPGITSSTAIGSYTYAPGVGQLVGTIANDSVSSPGGLFPAAIAGLRATDLGLASQISIEQQIVNEQQAALQQEFTNLESTLASMKSTSTFLASAFNGSGSLLGSMGSTSTSSSSSSSSTSGG